MIQANGIANFFLINPNGIMLGPNAKLDIGGSFIASTAEEIQFADGTIFSATNSQVEPLLSISLPIGLQFRGTANRIENQAFGSVENSVANFQVKPGKTLALVGGDILFTNNGSLIARGGRIELGSVAPDSFVSLTPISTGWVLGYETVQNFQDIQLTGQTYISVSNGSLAPNSGDIRLQGRQIVITDQSNIISLNRGSIPSGSIEIKASDFVEVSNGSNISTQVLSTGIGGDIKIQTNRLIINNKSTIGTLTTNAGKGGSLSVEATESLEVDGNGAFSQLLTQSQSSGDAGDLQAKTARLILRDGGQLSSSAFSSGKAGTLHVIDSESIEASGKGIFSGLTFHSGLFSSTAGKGNGGSVIVNTNRLMVTDGASISVAALEGSTRQAGQLDINASESVFLNGADSSLLATSESRKPAGNLTINTPLLTLQGGAKISASSPLSQGGNINLQGLNSLQVTNGSEISATTVDGKAGNLEINLGQTPVNNVQLNNGRLTVEATGTGDSGNLTVNARTLNLENNAQISASTISGLGGDVSLQNVETLQVTNGSEISATTVDGQAGNLEINLGQTPVNNVQLNNGRLTVEATGTGDSGNLTVNARTLNLENNAQISASTISGLGGDVNLQGLDILQISNSNITTSTQTGKAGNVSLNTNQKPVNSVQITDNSRLAAQASQPGGEAGSVSVNARDLTVNNGSSISASNISGKIGGDVNLQNVETLQVNGGEISATTVNGQAGNLEINLGQTPVNNVQLNNGRLTVEATGTGDSGNLTVNARTLNLENNAQISASTISGVGGDVNLRGLDTLQVNNSNISASTRSGRAGNLTVKAAQLVQLSGTGGLSVEATEGGTAGNLTVETRQMSVTDGAKVSVSSPQGQAGNLTIKANTLSLNRGFITAETGKSQGEGGANISLKISDLLRIENESLISATANGLANGGNIDIDTSDS
ncbi:filamentous hemagglutinin family domain-containing protein [Aphanothece sacrum FPU1]|uniref:Filamentous hemagglutinin family domain-containing protein n=1 Tax=Aphanothece sacrum FPU1 TaxID=1920663 RepID=A0A401IBG5_APHSA|nr:filamentous hemagglutinin family domain-containing protein [Aphanothece sacrum FPU1]